MTDKMPKEDALKPEAFRKDMEARGINSKFLITRLKREFNAKESRIIKVKGAIKQEELPKGFKIIGTSGFLAYTKKGEQVFGDGDTIIHYAPWNIGVQQRAREDVHKLRGDYAAEKTEDQQLTIIFESNVPEPDPLPKEDKPKTQEEDDGRS